MTMKTALFGIPGMAVLLLAGFVHGLWTGRWEHSTALEDAVTALRGVPAELGPWKGTAINLDATQMERAGAAGFVSRSYKDETRRAAVSMLLMCGRSGPVSVHTPEVCYDGAGYEMVGEPVEHPVKLGPLGTQARFRTVVMQKSDTAVPSYLRIFWAWSVPGQPWAAPANARAAFARQPALYKLYVIREVASPDELLDDDPAVAFIQRLLPELAAPPAAAPGKRP